jgi:hypothetical protein
MIFLCHASWQKSANKCLAGAMGAGYFLKILKAG